VKQELEDDLGTAPYGGSVVKAPKVLADIVEAIAAAVYVDCTFNLVKLWQVFIAFSCNSPFILC
jgi:dsRNA-specific ribonuclease